MASVSRCSRREGHQLRLRSFEVRAEARMQCYERAEQMYQRHQIEHLDSIKDPLDVGASAWTE